VLGGRDSEGTLWASKVLKMLVGLNPELLGKQGFVCWMMLPVVVVSKGGHKLEFMSYKEFNEWRMGYKAECGVKECVLPYLLEQKEVEKIALNMDSYLKEFVPPLESDLAALDSLFEGD